MEYSQTINQLVSQARTKRILVIGDVMLDQYIHGSHAGQSPEAPVPVIRHESSFSRPGGAANVALSLSSMGASTTLVGVCGDDRHGAELIELLQSEERLAIHLYSSPERRTTCKTRIIAGDAHVLRYDEEDRELLTTKESEALGLMIEQAIADTDLVVLQDYNKGTLTPPLIEYAINKCHELDVPVLADPKRLHISNYQGATLLKPNEKELRQIAADMALSGENVEGLATELHRVLELKHLLVTRGAQGAILVSYGENRRYEAEEIDLIDVCGAGDAVITMMAIALSCGEGIDSATRLGLHAAAVCCQHLGVYRMRAIDFTT